MKSLRSHVPAWVGALVAFGLLAAPAPAAAQLTGFVKSVDAAANRLSVTETRTGADRAIAVSGQTAVVTAAGETLTLKDLRKGDGVGITHRGGLATRIVVDQARLIGHVRSVDAEAKKLVVGDGAAGEAGAGGDVTVRVDDRTAITTADGKSLALGDLKKDDGVSIARAGDLARAIEVKAKPAELTGFVKSVAADLKSFVVTETGTNTDFTMAVNERTAITTTEGRTLAIKDLKPGDGVGISHVASVAQAIKVSVKPPR